MEILIAQLQLRQSRPLCSSMKPGIASNFCLSSEKKKCYCRQEVRAMTGAGDGDSVIFTGTGSTAAVELLVHLMQPEKLVRCLFMISLGFDVTFFIVCN